MISTLHRLIALAKKSGDTMIVHDPQTDDAMAILPLDRYEALLQAATLGEMDDEDCCGDLDCLECRDDYCSLCDPQYYVGQQAAHYHELTQKEIDDIAQKQFCFDKERNASQSKDDPFFADQKRDAPWESLALVESPLEEEKEDDVDWDAYEEGAHWVDEDFIDEPELATETPFEEVYRYEYPIEEGYPQQVQDERVNFFSYGKDAARFQPGGNDGLKKEQTEEEERPVFLEEPV